MNRLQPYKTLGLACCIGLTLAGCSDFLSILPPNEIVLENYWTAEADVENAVIGCYAALQSSDCIGKMAAWGEIRSDNIVPGMSTPDMETQVLKGNLLPSHSYSNWTPFYQVINRCNTVLYYAPMVNQEDPNYTPSELKATVAEVTALRNLCYFYLIRTFKDVPFVNQPSIDDNQNYRVPVSSFDSILTVIIDELELVKDDAVRQYANVTSNTARITRYSIYALLADMYLWKQDYANCVNYCDLVIDHKTKRYNEEKNTTASKVKLFGAYPLISEQIGGNTTGYAYNEIFGTGHSFESLFELDFEENVSISNSFISSYYGSNSTSVGYLSAAEFLFKDASSGNSMFKRTDCRYLESMEESNGVYAIDKYTRLTVAFDNSPGTSGTTYVNASRRSTSYANWIIYRLTDVMLMKAEAEVQLAGVVDPNAITPEQRAHYRTAFSLVSSVYNRANNIQGSRTDTLVFNNFANNRITMEDLVLKERQRELLFEGKRWYDLVRLARREGNNNRLINYAVTKYIDNQSAMRKKMNAPLALYFPYSESELKVNPYLKQNPAYETGSTTNITD